MTDEEIQAELEAARDAEERARENGAAYEVVQSGSRWLVKKVGARGGRRPVAGYTDRSVAERVAGVLEGSVPFEGL